MIETPLGYSEADGLKTYTVCVDSNQCWRIIRDKQADWVEVSEPELMSGHYGGRFTVRVRSNAGKRVKNGFPAARHTILSLINDTGIVKDILVYQGGYVRIRGQYWLDRNLADDGKPAPVAIPLGLEEGSKANHAYRKQTLHPKAGAYPPTSRWKPSSTAPPHLWSCNVKKTARTSASSVTTAYQCICPCAVTVVTSMAAR